MIFNKKTPKEKILKFIKNNFSNNVASLLSNNLIESIELDINSSRKTTLGCSKWAGFPDLPINAIWPENLFGKLDFLLQINLEENENYIELLPSKGMLYVFIDLENLYSDELKNHEKIKIIFSDNHEKLVTQDVTKLNNQIECRLDIVKTYAVLQPRSPEFENIGLTDDEFDNLDELLFTTVEKYIGKSGYYKIGQHFNDSVLLDWSESTDSKSETDYFSVFNTLLDTLGYPDCWLEIGILKTDLKNKKFDNALLALY